MSNQLRISTLRVTKFGGLKNLTQEFPSENLITIFGSNEAGKSTLAEAIMWLIAGPTGTASEIARFGNPTDTLVAELAGLLDGSEFLLNSKFKVLAGGISSAQSLFEAQIDGAVLPSRRCGRRLGGWRGHR